MKRENWNDLIVFARANELGSFTKAAKELGISPSAVSHIIRNMENRLDTRLLHRSTRSITATEAGHKLIADLVPAIETLSQTIESLTEDNAQVSGRIRITSHKVAAHFTLLPRLADFMDLNPKVSVEVDIDDSLVDFIGRGFDAGVRRRESLAADMIAVQIDHPVRLIYLASPRYLKNFGTPETPQDLKHHRCINYRFPTAKSLFAWPFNDGKQEYSIEVPSQLVFNNTDMLLNAAIADCGIACVTEEQAAIPVKSGKLVQLFQNNSVELPPNYIYFSGRNHIPSALRSFIDFMKV